MLAARFRSASLRSLLPALRPRHLSVDAPATTSDVVSAPREARELFADPFLSPSRSLSQVLNLVDHLLDAPFPRRLPRRLPRGWDAREGEDGLHLRVDMPGLGKEDVRVTVEQSTLVIRGEGGEAEEGGTRRYSSRIDLPAEVYNQNGVRAEMRNGVLKVFVPKVAAGERRDAVEVPIE